MIKSLWLSAVLLSSTAHASLASLCAAGVEFLVAKFQRPIFDLDGKAPAEVSKLLESLEWSKKFHELPRMFSRYYSGRAEYGVPGDARASLKMELISSSTGFLALNFSFNTSGRNGIDVPKLMELEQIIIKLRREHAPHLTAYEGNLIQYSGSTANTTQVLELATLAAKVQEAVAGWEIRHTPGAPQYPISTGRNGQVSSVIGIDPEGNPYAPPKTSVRQSF